MQGMARSKICPRQASIPARVRRRPNGNLYSQVGDFYREGSDWRSAQKYYQVAAKRLRPNDPWAHERFAYALFQQEKFEVAAVEYQEVIDLSYGLAYVPDGVYCAMALAQENAGEITLAVTTYRRCMESATDPARKKRPRTELNSCRAGSDCGQRIRVPTWPNIIRYRNTLKESPPSDRASGQFRLSFQDIERIIGDDSPPSAHNWSAWWANQTRFGCPSACPAWLLAGWRVDEVDLRLARVRFRRRTT